MQREQEPENNMAVSPIAGLQSTVWKYFTGVNLDSFFFHVKETEFKLIRQDSRYPCNKSSHIVTAVRQ